MTPPGRSAPHRDHQGRRRRRRDDHRALHRARPADLRRRRRPGRRRQLCADDAGAPARDDGYAVALRWTALTPGRTMDAVCELNLAQDWDQFRAAAALFDVPAQNLVYAAVDGNIGYQAPGSIPIRSGYSGRYPAAGWDPGQTWTGYIPFDALPNVRNPADGYIVTANQAAVGRSIPVPPHRGLVVRRPQPADRGPRDAGDVGRGEDHGGPCPFDPARHLERERGVPRAEDPVGGGDRGRRRRAAAVRRLGPHPAGGLGGGGVLQRVLEEPAAGQLRHRAARGLPRRRW